MKQIKYKKGFTIIELIVVMAIIGVLVLLAMPKFMGYTEKARLTEIKSNTKQLENASERYYIDNQDWPRLTDVSYTADQISTFAQEITNKSGQVVTLDLTGQYYDIDYSKIQQYVQKPKSDIHYILQNPVGEIYYLKNLTPVGESRLTIPIVINNKPTAVITMTPNQELTTATIITWSSSTSTDIDGDTIKSVEWDNKQGTYTTAGTYTVKLRVQDEHDLWSDWISTTFNVVADVVIEHNAQMYKVLLTPETSWIRFDDSNNNISHNDSYYNYGSIAYNNSVLWLDYAGAYARFDFVGKNIRIIGTSSNYYSKAHIYIDGQDLGYYDCHSLGTYQWQTLLFEKLNLTAGRHTVNIYRDIPLSGNNQVHIDAIDLESGGYLLPYSG